MATSSGGFSVVVVVDDSDAVDGDDEGLEAAASDGDDEVVEYVGDAVDGDAEGIEVVANDEYGYQNQCHQQIQCHQYHHINSLLVLLGGGTKGVPSYKEPIGLTWCGCRGRCCS